jgi:DNA-binding MurR/RpiR family transcriptional regulator
LQLGSVQARIAQLFVVDVLFNELCRRMGEEAQQNRESVVNALADKHM